MALSCGFSFIELASLSGDGRFLSRRQTSPRISQARGRNLALRGFHQIRVSIRHSRRVKCVSYENWRNASVDVGNSEDLADLHSNSELGSELDSNLDLEFGYGENGLSVGEGIAVDGVSGGRLLNELSIEDCYGEEKDGTAVETGEGRSERSKLGFVSTSLGNMTGQVVSDEVEYYVPEIGHRVLGVVVSGSRTKFGVDIGSSMLGELKVTKLFPLDRFQIHPGESTYCVGGGARDTFTKPPLGCPCMVYDREVFAFEDPALFIIDIGTVLELVVIGKSLNGSAVLSVRKAAERFAWDRVKQIKELKQAIQVEVIDWNLSGGIARIEGLRAFLPLKEFLNRPDSVEDYVGTNLWVIVNFVDESNHSLVISERKAWVGRNLLPGSLHNGTVTGILPFGVRVQVNGTNIMGLIHISNIAHALIKEISDVFEVGEQVKMMVVNSDSLNTLSFSTADLESECGLMLHDKQRVYQEAEQTANAWWIENRKTKEVEKNDLVDLSDLTVPEPIANLDWIQFEQ